MFIEHRPCAKHKDQQGTVLLIPKYGQLRKENREVVGELKCDGLGRKKYLIGRLRGRKRGNI